MMIQRDQIAANDSPCNDCACSSRSIAMAGGCPMRLPAELLQARAELQATIDARHSDLGPPLWLTVAVLAVFWVCVAMVIRSCA